MKSTTNMNSKPATVNGNDAAAILAAIANMLAAAPVAPAAPAATVAYAAGYDEPIEWKAVARKNERCLVYDIRESLCEDDTNNVVSLVKSWLHMVKHEHANNDYFVLDFVHELEIACFARKDFTCKATEGKNPRFEICSQGMVKSALYTIARNNTHIARVDSKPAARPEEKPAVVRSSSPRKPVAEMTDEEVRAHYLALAEKKIASLRK